MAEDEQKELLDLVDDRDVVIGTIRRGEFQRVINDPPGNIRVAEAFIIRGDGKLWMPRRTLGKTIAPGGLDFSVAEHVSSGETYRQAIERGFREELRVSIKTDELESVAVLPPQPDFPLFRGIFLYRSDVEPQYNREDFTGFEWLTPREVVSRIEGGEAAKRNLAPTIRTIFHSDFVE